MKMSYQLASLICAILAVSTSGHVHYVNPSDSSPQQCPGQPCLTLDQYTEQTDVYFTTGATFVFLPGNHSLEIGFIYLTNISDITLRGKENESDITVLCKNEVTTCIKCENITKLIIEGLIFILDTNKLSEDSAVLDIFYSKQIVFYKLLLLGSGNLNTTLLTGVYSYQSDIEIVSCIFAGNTGYYGGAILAFGGSNITLNGNIFTGNKASFGGAIYTLDSFLNMKDTLGNTFSNNTARTFGGVLYSNRSNIIIDSNCSLYAQNESTLPIQILTFREIATQPCSVNFLNNAAPDGGAMLLRNSSVKLCGRTAMFAGNSAIPSTGGAMFFYSSNVVLNSEYLYFFNNTAAMTGGAIFSYNSSLMLGNTSKHHHFFTQNSCGSSGGAILSREGNLEVAGNGWYTNNSASIEGGAITVLFGRISMSGKVSFTNNYSGRGAGVYLLWTNAVLGGTLVEFIKNRANKTGGGLLSLNSKLLTKAHQFNFINNIAFVNGGGMHSENNTKLRLTSVNFINNTSTFELFCGGALYIYNEKDAQLQNVTFTTNTHSALCITKSSVILKGAKFYNNHGTLGGGVAATNSFVSFTHYTLLQGNAAQSGGGIAGFNSELVFEETTLFHCNTGFENGGAIYASDSDVTFRGEIIRFSSNTARLGGAMYFSSTSTLTMEPHTTINTSHNYASQYGGVLYHVDTPANYQCEYVRSGIKYLPRCFFQLKDLTTTQISYSMTSFNDSARKGYFLYGGLLDRCQIRITNNVAQTNTNVQGLIRPYKILTDSIFHIVQSNYTMTHMVTSQPYQLCFCEKKTAYCSRAEERKLYRGQRFEVFLLALAQGGVITSALVTAKVSSTARLKLNQSIQYLSPDHESLSYNLYSTNITEQLILYPNGPCHDTGLAKAVIDVTFLPCPDAFTLQGERCVCEERLQVYGAECIIDENIYIERKAGSRFWMNVSHTNDTYQGLILYKTCPFGYCTNDTVRITLDNLDIQCDLNRSGVLCGTCDTNYSLTLGSSQCQICSNTYLALLVPFAAAGIALVVFLAMLRFTVATGMINSLILYANIVQVNKSLFFPINDTNLLTVSMAWLNLDLGFKTCFYDGMDAYATVWLQFAFPVYIWILICLIILTSRYSIRVSKLIGSNPIAVLATLLLMSYTTVLKVIIDVYSSVDLEYPDKETVTVWLKDANIPYLQSKHLVLTVVTTLVLVFLFLPYTILLLLGHKLYRYSGRKCRLWLNRLKPILDSYYAPYKIHTRFWTGFLLLVRCALYVLFSINSLGDSTKSLLAIIITFTVIGIASGYLASGRIYNNYYTNIIEASVYLNLVILSAATATNTNTPALVYTLVGTVFVTMIGVIVYHFHLTYTAKSIMWLKVKAKLFALKARFSTGTGVTVNTPLLANSSTHNPHRMAVSLREPLLAD